MRILLLALFLTSATHAAQPNIILFMADDMGMGDSSAYQDFTGNADADQIHTPNMERLARMGMRFTDAHTPASRCTTTRYGLLTGRYAFRNRMKYWVLFGNQGDPMIERDRPTIATLLKDQGYRTAMFGKWHVGLRYRNSKGKPAAAWEDADLTQPLYDCPLDHGFDVAKYTSRSHGTSGPDAGAPAKNKARRNGPNQTVGPGHLHGRIAVSASGDGKALKPDGPDAYVLTKLGSRHSDHAIDFIRSTKDPFFLYYPANSNHGPYTPDKSIGGKPVAGAARTKSGEGMNARYDYIYENDVALGRLLDQLESQDDPRNPGKKLIENTIVIFTSDNGSENKSKVCTGPFRSNKGSVFEGGHRVPFIVAWPTGNIPAGTTSGQLLGLQDLFATFAEITGVALPNLHAGEKGAEDSVSVLDAWRNKPIADRPIFFHDHKDAKGDQAVAALRLDNPTVDGKTYQGQWKMFFDPQLLRMGIPQPTALYELSADQQEANDRLNPELEPLIQHLSEVAQRHRNTGGHRLADASKKSSVTIDFTQGEAWRKQAAAAGLHILAHKKTSHLVTNPRGLGVAGNGFDQVNAHESLNLRFNQDVLIENVAIVAGNGTCGGYYTVGDDAPLAIYCVDGDNDSNNQHGVLSDLGVLKQGEVLSLHAAPHFGVETQGQWRLGSVTFRDL